MEIRPFLKTLFQYIRLGIFKRAQIYAFVLGDGSDLHTLGKDLYRGQVIFQSFFVDEFFNLVISRYQRILIVGDETAQVVSKGYDFIGHLVVVCLPHFKGGLERPFDGDIEPILDGCGNELNGDKKEYDRR